MSKQEGDGHGRQVPAQQQMAHVSLGEPGAQPRSGSEGMSGAGGLRAHAGHVLAGVTGQPGSCPLGSRETTARGAGSLRRPDSRSRPSGASCGVS